MKRGRVPNKWWPAVTFRCHERMNGERCRREVGHGCLSNNETLNQLNGWHQAPAGCWKDGVFLNWQEFEALRKKVFTECGS